MDFNSSMDSTLNGSMDINTGSNDELLRGTSLSLSSRLIGMVAAVLSFIMLLLAYTLMDKVKGTMLGKLMKSYCVLSLLALFAYILYTLMEYVVPATNASCSTLYYFTYYTYLAALISKALFLFHIGYIFYCSYKLVLKDTTDDHIFRLKSAIL